MGTRLQAQEGHKLLARVGGRTLFSYHVENFAHLGVRSFVIVTGFQAPLLEKTLARVAEEEGLEVRFARNEEFRKGNGLSVLAGANLLFEEKGPQGFWLTMSDHLYVRPFFEDLAQTLEQEGLNPEREEEEPHPGVRCDGALCVDMKVETIFDVPDATKLQLHSQPLQISKELDHFDAVDTGLFWCGPGFVKALQEALQSRGDCSTSDAVQTLHARGRFRFLDVGPALWQDVDTPEARGHAEKLLATD